MRCIVSSGWAGRGKARWSNAGLFEPGARRSGALIAVAVLALLAAGCGSKGGAGKGGKTADTVAPKITVAVPSSTLFVSTSGTVTINHSATSEPTAPVVASPASSVAYATTKFTRRTGGAYPPIPMSGLDFRPNDGSGFWPDFSNTGYANTPANAGGLGLGAYPGRLTDYATGMSDKVPLTVHYPDNSVIAYTRFLAQKVYIYGDNLTFIGCLFEGTNPNDNLIQIYAPTRITFRYSTFKPSSYAMPPGNDGTVTSAKVSPGTPFNQSWQLATTMDQAVATMDHNDVWGNAGLEMVTGFPGRPSVWTNNYIHDAADSANNIYHHDGIGPQSEGNGGPMVINHNTIASLGNTNGLALQGDGIYDQIRFTNNYISGWGYAISIGVKNNATNVTFTGNVMSAELTQLYGPLYGNLWGGLARGSAWSGNRIQVRSGDGNRSYTTSDHGKYWWPTDNSAHVSDYSN